MMKVFALGRQILFPLRALLRVFTGSCEQQHGLSGYKIGCEADPLV
jgi:hypothetical protein